MSIETEFVPESGRWIRWGETPCATCFDYAVLTLDGLPACIECADLTIDRTVALEIWPALRETLPTLRDR